MHDLAGWDKKPKVEWADETNLLARFSSIHLYNLQQKQTPPKRMIQSANQICGALISKQPPARAATSTGSPSSQRPPMSACFRDAMQQEMPLGLLPPIPSLGSPHPLDTWRKGLDKLGCPMACEVDWSKAGYRQAMSSPCPLASVAACMHGARPLS